MKKRIKIYLSGAMTNLTKEQYVKNFEEMENHLKQALEEYYEQVLIINPCKKRVNTMHGFDYEDCLTVDFATIDICDAIAMLPNWKQSKGANRELNYAKAKQKLIIFSEFFKNKSFELITFDLQELLNETN